jgi:hypothetical protein
MTSRRSLLLTIHVLLRRMESIETDANAELDRLRLAQVEHDARIVAHWERQVQILIDANEDLRRQLGKKKLKRWSVQE